MAVIRKYELERLTGFREILESRGEIDLVNVSHDRRINLDYDWKRKLVTDDRGVVLPSTMPHQNILEMLRYRSAMESIRKSGIEARPELVQRKVVALEARLRARGGEAVAVTQMFLRGMLQGKFTTTCTLSYEQRAAVLKDIWQAQAGLQQKYPKQWQKSDLQNASTKGKWVPGAYMPTPELTTLVDTLCAAFGADPDVVNHLIFDPISYHDYSDKLVEQVALAVLFAASKGCDIFVRLKALQYLPGLQLMQERFPAITPAMMQRLTHDRFVPGALPSSDCQRLTEMFYLLGVPWRFCQQCARVISPSAAVCTERKWNPSEKKCVESFVQAIFQPNLPIRRPKIEVIIDRLFPFNVTRSRLYALRGTKFHRYTINDTRTNRFLIKRMARSIGCSADPFLALLLAPSEDKS